MVVISVWVLLLDKYWMYEHIYTLSWRIYDICALATAALAVYFIPFLVLSLKRSSSFPTWVVFLSSVPPLACPRAELKSIKHPNILLNMGGLCHAAAPCNAYWVIMVITQPSEARPEACGMTRSDQREWWLWKQGCRVKVKRGRVGLWCYSPINPCCHIRGCWMYVDIPLVPLLACDQW